MCQYARVVSREIGTGLSASPERISKRLIDGLERRRAEEKGFRGLSSGFCLGGVQNMMDERVESTSGALNTVKSVWTEDKRSKEKQV